MRSEIKENKIINVTKMEPIQVSLVEGVDVAASFFEKEETDGLTKEDVVTLLNDFKKTPLYPLEIEAERVESSAMGFISARFADMLEYDYRNLRNFVSMLLGNPNNKSGQYLFDGQIINLRRLEVYA